MGYFSKADIEKLIPDKELAELSSGSGDTPDALMVTEAIDKADDEIDSYLGVRNTVPFSSAPARMKSFSEDIAIYYFCTRRSVATALRQKKYDKAITYLRNVAAGWAVLFDGSSETSVGVSRLRSSTVPHRTLTVTMTSW